MRRVVDILVIVATNIISFRCKTQSLIYTQMRPLLIRFLNKLLRFEHIIYCATNCKIEFLLHKKYYEHRRKKYDSYIQEKNYLQSISSKI